MTELDIERERRQFEAVFQRPTPEKWTGWLAAKRAVLESAEPVAFAFVIVDKNGNPEFVTSTHDEAQAHINDAISEHNIHGAGKWRSIPAYEMRPSDDKLWDQALRERDYNAEVADKLAEAIAQYFSEEIGEHSNANCPWLEALRVIEEAAPPAPVSAEPVKYASAEDYLRGKHGAYRGHHAWRELEQAFNAGVASAPPSTDAKDSLHVPDNVRHSAEFTRADLGDTGTNYPHVRALLEYVEAAIAATETTQ